MNRAQPFISVIIPAYNEAARILPTLESISRFFRDRTLPYEVVVVDDGSTDGTHKKVAEHSVVDPRVRTLVQSKNRGKGAAVARGMRESSGTWRLFMDADGSVAINHLDAFLGYTHLGCDIVIGSIETTQRRKDQNGLLRKVLRTLAKRLIRTLATPGIRDTQRGFKLFSASAAEDIFSQLTVMRFGFDIETLVIARARGYEIMEAPVIWHNPAGHSVTLRSYLTTLIELCRILLRAWTGAYRPEGARKTGGQLVRFIVAGVANTTVDIAVFNALFVAFGAVIPLFVYKAISFSAAVVNSFYWNRYFVFDAKVKEAKDEARLRFAKFLIISVGGLAINALSFEAAHTALVANALVEGTLSANAAAVLATCASLLWNFIGYKYVVFTR